MALPAIGGFGFEFPQQCYIFKRNHDAWLAFHLKVAC